MNYIKQPIIATYKIIILKQYCFIKTINQCKVYIDHNHKKNITYHIYDNQYDIDDTSYIECQGE